MNTRPLIIVLVIVVLLLIGYAVYSQMDEGERTNTATTTQQNATNPVVETPSAPTAVTITYTANGYSPTNVVVAPGTTVTWVNQTSERMWTAADEHPTHTTYDGTSREEHCTNGASTNAGVFDQCTAGQSYSFTFTKAGTWNYHNHAQASHGGSVTVR